MNLVIDSGNSAAKVGIFDHESLIEKRVFVALEDLKKFIQDNYFDDVIISQRKVLRRKLAMVIH